MSISFRSHISNDQNSASSAGTRLKHNDSNPDIFAEESLIFDKRVRNFTEKHLNEGVVGIQDLETLFEGIVRTASCDESKRFINGVFVDIFSQILSSHRNPFDLRIHTLILNMCESCAFLERVIRHCHFGLINRIYIQVTEELHLKLESGSQESTSQEIDEKDIESNRRGLTSTDSDSKEYYSVARGKEPYRGSSERNLSHLSHQGARNGALYPIKLTLLSIIVRLVHTRRWLYVGYPTISNFLLNELGNISRMKRLHTLESLRLMYLILSSSDFSILSFSSSGSNDMRTPTQAETKAEVEAEAVCIVRESEKKGPHYPMMYLARLAWKIDSEMHEIGDDGSIFAVMRDFTHFLKANTFYKSIPLICDMLRRKELEMHCERQHGNVLPSMRLLDLLSFARIVLLSEKARLPDSFLTASELSGFEDYVQVNPYLPRQKPKLISSALVPTSPAAMRNFIIYISQKCSEPGKEHLNPFEMEELHKNTGKMCDEGDGIFALTSLSIFRYLKSTIPFLLCEGLVEADYFDFLLNLENGIIVEVSDLLEKRAICIIFRLEIEMEILFTLLALAQHSDYLSLLNKSILRFHVHSIVSGLLKGMAITSSLLNMSNGNLNSAIQIMLGKLGMEVPSEKRMRVMILQMQKIALQARVLGFFAELGDVDLTDHIAGEGVLEAIICALEDIKEVYDEPKEMELENIDNNLSNPNLEMISLEIPPLAIHSPSIPVKVDEEMDTPLHFGRSLSVDKSHSEFNRVLNMIRAEFVAVAFAVLFGGGEHMKYPHLDLIQHNGKLLSIFHILFSFIADPKQKEMLFALSSVADATGSKALLRIVKMSSFTRTEDRFLFKRLPNARRLIVSQFSMASNASGGIGTRLSSHLGAGRYGRVINCFVKGEYNGSKAMKVIPIKEELESNNVNYQSIVLDTYDEISVLERFSGDTRICRMYDYGFDGENEWILMERYLCDLLEWRQRYEQHCSSKGNSTNIYYLLNVFEKVLDAVTFLPENGIVHHDLKCENLLLDPSPFLCSESDLFEPPDEKPLFKLVLADFGESLEIEASLLTLRTRGTECNMSPEMFDLSINNETRRLRRLKMKSIHQGSSSRKGSHQSDVWSLGCLFFELLTGRKLFADREHTSYLESIEEELFLTHREEMRLKQKDSIIEFLKWILRANPRRRPELGDVALRFKEIKETI